MPAYAPQNDIQEKKWLVSGSCGGVYGSDYSTQQEFAHQQTIACNTEIVLHKCHAHKNRLKFMAHQ